METNAVGGVEVASPRDWLTTIGRRWTSVKRLYTFLLPVRFSAIALAVVGFALVWSDQGRDVIAALVEHDPSGSEIAVHAIPRWCFVPLVTLLALQIWYWSRQLLSLRFEGHPAASEFPTVTLVIPRLLGVLTYAVAFAAVRRVVSKATGATASTCLWLEVVLAATALAFLGFCSVRRRWLESSGRSRNLGEQAPGVQSLPRSSRIVLGATFGAAVVFFLLATLRVQNTGLLGSSAILILSMSFWVSFGSVLAYVGGQARIPVFTWLLLFACLVSPWTDNHAIRVLEPSLSPRPSVSEAFAAWYGHLTRDHPNEPHPVFIAAAEGGGIRAAYWTAAVLATLADDVPGFREHLFAISGVSGGSLGAGVFDALLSVRDDRLALPPRQLRDAAAHVLAHDALAPTLAAMLQPDLLQRLLLTAFLVLPDRARALEGGWETAWESEIEGDDRMTGGFLSMFQQRGDALPALFLNGTVVETGQRIIASNLGFTRDLTANGRPLFADTLDLLNSVGGDIRLSTAIHNSARFTYVSPAGTIRRGGMPLGASDRMVCGIGDPCEHVIDGGYFENSGAVTAVDIASAIRLSAHVNPYVLVIRYREKEPEPPPSARWLTEPLAPVWGMLKTRDARGTLAVEQLDRDIDRPPIVFELVHYPGTVKLPLGWLLSAETRVAIDRQIGPGSGDNSRSMDTVAHLLGTGPKADPFYEKVMQGVLGSQGTMQ